MGIGSASGQRTQTFTEDVLRLEISGPDEEHFSVIDVPGIFKRTTSGVTTKEDIALVNNMVHDYMSNPRSVMLTVIPCNTDIATQEILEKADDLDPEGLRTFGILTKPDLVDESAEGPVLELLNGLKHQLRLGWHLLRNPGQKELDSHSKTRQELEREFLRKAPWNKVARDKFGIDSLRNRLQEILAEHIRREFPKVTDPMGPCLLDSS